MASQNITEQVDLPNIPSSPKHRQSNFELLRIVAILMVLTMHVVGLAHKDIAQGSFNRQFEMLVNVVCNTGVDAFVLISGWFGIRRKRLRFLDLVLLSIVCVFATQLYVTHCQDPWEAFRKGYRAVLAYGNWFVGCYLLLYLIAPWLNDFLETLQRESFRRLVTTLVVAVGVVPALFDAPDGGVIYWHGKCFAWMTTVYVLGRYLRLHHDGCPSRRKALALFSLPLALIYLFILTCDLRGETFSPSWCGDNSPFMLCGAIGLFCLFRTFTFSSRWVNQVGSSVFAVFLTNGMMKRLDADVFGVASSGTSPWLAPLVLGEVVSVFAIGVAFDKLYRRLLGWPHAKAIALASWAYDRLCRLLSPYVSRL